jgi:hypothetical protein
MYHFNKKVKPQKSAVYDVYWQFAARRLAVFTNRIYNPNAPWTDDPVLQKNKFTNVFRASDRVSQYLIDLQYKGDNNRDVFFKTMLFKLFNKIETYAYLERELGSISASSFDFQKYNDLLSMRMASGRPIYSAAYIMPSAGQAFGHKLKHTNHLALLQKMLDDRLDEKIYLAESLEQVYKLLLSYPSLGSFLAFQYSIYLNYSEIINFSEMDFVVAGPGAKNGIRKCFNSLCDYSHEDIIKLMVEEQEVQCTRLNLPLPQLFGRALQLIDCQNLFCEVDKYLRATHPELSEASGRTRIKQKYTVSKGPQSFFFPPKWNINNNVREICRYQANVGIFS